MAQPPKKTNAQPPSINEIVEAYTIPFDKKGEFDRKRPQWAKATVTCRVLPGKRDLIFLRIAEVIKITLDGQGPQVLSIEPVKGKIEGLYYVTFDVHVKDIEMAKAFLRQNKRPAIDATVEVKVDPTSISHLAGMLPPGFGPAIAGAINRPTVRGRTQLLLELPHPFIVIPALKSHAPSELEIDTAETAGTPYEVHLLKYVPESEQYEERDEELKFVIMKQMGESIAKNPFEIIPEGPSKFFLKSMRVIIGDQTSTGALNTQALGEIEVSRKKGLTPAATNQPLKAVVKYKPIPKAKLFIKVLYELNGKYEELQKFEEEVDGETVEILFPDLPPQLKAKIRWKVIEPHRVLEDKSGFRTKDEETDLVPSASGASGTADCLGKVIEIVKDPITKATKPLRLNTPSPNPYLKLETNHDTAKADGTFEVIITPHLTIFGKKMKGLKIKPETSDPRSVSYQSFPAYNPYFRADKISEEDGNERQHLLCKFHLGKDDAIDALNNLPADVSFNVYPTGEQAKLFPQDGVKPNQPAKITLKLSKLDFSVEPANLPGDIKKSDPLFESKVRVRILSSDDLPVSREAIDKHPALRKAYFAERKWKLGFELKRPGASRDSIPLTIDDVDSNGWVKFDTTERVNEENERQWNSVLVKAALKWFWTSSDSIGPYCVYDHLNKYWDHGNYQLTQQDCEVEVSLRAKGINEKKPIKIKKQVAAVHISWDFSPFFLSKDGPRPVTHDPTNNYSGFMSFVPFYDDMIARGYTRSIEKKFGCVECLRASGNYGLHSDEDPRDRPKRILHTPARTGDCELCTNRGTQLWEVFFSNERYTRVSEGAYMKTEWNKNTRIYEILGPPPIELPTSFPLGTVLVGGLTNWSGGHHGIVVADASGSQKIRHFLMAKGKPQFKWFNRDQVMRMLTAEGQKKRPENKPRTDLAAVFEAYAFEDTLRDWMIRSAMGAEYVCIDVMFK